jgi:hypothetical protein
METDGSPRYLRLTLAVLGALATLLIMALLVVALAPAITEAIQSPFLLIFPAGIVILVVFLSRAAWRSTMVNGPFDGPQPVPKTNNVSGSWMSRLTTVLSKLVGSLQTWLRREPKLA